MSAQYQLITNGEELRRAADELFNKQAIGLDTETTELDPYLGRLRLVQLASADQVYIIDLNAFRDVKIFHEHVINVMLEDFVKACDPLCVEIEGDFNVRGNIKTTVRANYRRQNAEGSKQ